MPASDCNGKQDNLDSQGTELASEWHLKKIDDVFRSSLSSSSSSSMTQPMKHGREDLENAEDVRMDEDNNKKDDVTTYTAKDDSKENEDNDLDDVVGGNIVMQVNLSTLSEDNSRINR